MKKTKQAKQKKSHKRKVSTQAINNSDAWSALARHLESKETAWFAEKKAAQNWINSGCEGFAITAPGDGLLAITRLHQIKQHLKSLLQMSLKSDFRDSTRSPFLGETLAEVKAIGQDLFDWGGFGLMHAIADSIPSYDQSELDRAWDGVGTWKC